MASVAIGLWACGDDNGANSAECTTEECLIQKYGEFNADSANQAILDSINAALQNMQGGDSIPTNFGNGEDSLSSAAADPLSSGAAVPTSSGAVVPGSSDASVPGSSDAVPGSSAAVVPGSSAAVNPGSSATVVPGSSAAIVASSSSVEVVIPQAPEFKEDHRSECTIGNIQTSVNNAKLPDPFKMLDGTVISSKDQWKCRREEIGAIYEKVMFGEKPRNPEKVEGKMSGGKYTVTVTDKGKTASFSVTVKSAGTADKPKPALIGLDQGFGTCGSLGNATSGLDIAMITFNTNDLAPENSPSGGAFGKLYSVPGTIIAWAWGVSRLIDALENDPSAGIDVHHLAVTGCSRLGKAALAIGAFDERIALTIPQESGSGGASLWRVGAQVNKQKGKQFVQGLGSAGSEGNWMIGSFKNYDGKENTLPMDQHMLTAMVAPRALLVIDNAGQEWLGEVPSNYCGQASKEVFDALGVTENYTYTQEGGHAHCSLPSEQFDEVKDFINKFLLGKDVKTGKIDYSKNTQTINWNKSEWIDWTTPTLN